jgi:hypothetical protein
MTKPIKKAFVVEPDGTRYVQEFQDDELRVLQNVVEGLIEPIDIAHDMTMWVNEEGKLVGKTPNPFATATWLRKFGLNDIVVGTVAFTGGTDDEGATLGLADEHLKILQKIADKFFDNLTAETIEEWQNNVKDAALL